MGRPNSPGAMEVVQGRFGEGLVELRGPLDRLLELAVAAVEGDDG